MSDSLTTSPETEDQPLEIAEWEEEERDSVDDQEWNRHRQKKRHWTMLWIAIAVVVFAFALQVKGETQVAFHGFTDYPLPELCGSRSLFHVDCPGCGLTRSILSLAHGDWERSLAFHRIGWVMALVIVLQIPYRIYRLHELKSRVPEVRWPQWFGHCLVALLMINWLYNCLI